MTHGAIEWIEIPTIDPHASTEFYRQVFGWEIMMSHGTEEYPMFKDTTGKVGGGFTRSARPMTEAGVLIFVSVDSIDEILTRIIAHGGQTSKPRTEISPQFGWWAVFRDPTGNLVGLYERPATL